MCQWPSEARLCPPLGDTSLSIMQRILKIASDQLISGNMRGIDK